MIAKWVWDETTKLLSIVQWVGYRLHARLSVDFVESIGVTVLTLQSGRRVTFLLRYVDGRPTTAAGAFRRNSVNKSQ